MNQKLNIPPPKAFDSFGPSELFRFFFQIGHWTEESFSSDFQTFARGKTVSTVTVSKWKNKDVIPTRYTSAFFKLIEASFETTIAAKWITAFETVWAHHVARPKTLRKTDNALYENKVSSDDIIRQHGDWIQKKYTSPILSETFSASDIYVPLDLVEDQPEAWYLYEARDLTQFALQGWREEPYTDWTLISGDPGSGKSMTALHLANTFAELDVFQIYLRLSHLSTIEIDVSDTTHPVTDSFSVSSFLQHFRSSSKAKACLILDGLDDISGGQNRSNSKLIDLISNLKVEQEICNLHGKILRIIILGRAESIEQAVKHLRQTRIKKLKMVSIKGSVKLLNSEGEDLVGEDLRPEWWNNYTTAKGFTNCPELPAFLCETYNEFFEFGGNPLLIYLICRTALSNEKAQELLQSPNKIIDALTYKKNKNPIYQKIIEQIRCEDIWRDSTVGILNPTREQFLLTLQYISLTHWHNNGQRKIKIEDLKYDLKDEVASNLLSAIMFSNEALGKVFINNITTVFNLPNDRNKDALKFTHQTFSEYLLSTLILDKFTALISAFINNQDLKSALSDWMALCSAGTQDPTLADFCQNEAALRYDSLIDLDWDAALRLLKTDVFQSSFEKTNTKSILDFIEQLKLAGSLIFLIWSCLNRERYAREDVSFLLTDSDASFGPSDLKRIHLFNPIDSKNTTLQESSVQNTNFLGHSLCGVHLDSADMNTLNFITGHIETSVFSQASFNMTCWNRIKITSCIFKQSLFRHTDLLSCDILGTLFKNCFFQFSSFNQVRFYNSRFKDTYISQCHFLEADFRKAELKGTVFERCIFVNSTFSLKSDFNSDDEVMFRNCIFINMEDAYNQIPRSALEECTYEKPTTETSKIFDMIEGVYTPKI